jgi:hypothetical protein
MLNVIQERRMYIRHIPRYTTLAGCPLALKEALINPMLFCGGVQYEYD